MLQLLEVFQLLDSANRAAPAAPCDSAARAARSVSAACGAPAAQGAPQFPLSQRQGSEVTDRGGIFKGHTSMQVASAALGAPRPLPPKVARKRVSSAALGAAPPMDSDGDF